MSGVKTLVDLRNSLSKELENPDFWILGKGPTLKYCDQYDFSHSISIALNHACLVVSATIAHFTDLEAFKDCSSHLVRGNEAVLMPLLPHINNWPRRKTLDELMASEPDLELLSRQGRLYGYQTSNTPRQLGACTEVIEVRYFSVEPAFQIAIRLGAKEVWSLGVDGGVTYSASIPQVGQRRLLQNGRTSFDAQWRQLELLQRRYGVEMKRARTIPTVFVGSSEREEIPFKVLEWSIHKNASTEIAVEPLPPVRRQPKHKKNRARTPFSFSRFLIPELMGYRGIAVYMDSDMLVFGDINSLFSVDMSNHDIAVCRHEVTPERWLDNPNFRPGPQYSVMVINCNQCDWRIEKIIDALDRGDLQYGELLHHLSIVSPERIRDDLDPSWNSLEQYIPRETKNLHFTVVPTQPWKNPSTSFAQVWRVAFQGAVRDGYISRELFLKSRRRGYIHKTYTSDFYRNFSMVTSHSGRSSRRKVSSFLADNYFRLQSIVRNLKWRVSIRSNAGQ